MSTTTLPEGFADLEPWVEDWAKPTRAERYEVRLAKPFEETCEFYDAIAARAEEAIAHLNGLDLAECGKLGAAVGAAALAGTGDYETLPGWAEARRLAAAVTAHDQE